MIATAFKTEIWKQVEKNAPITTYCNFDHYQKIAEALSMPATKLLIWTIHGSPLNVPGTDTEPLTSHDVFFRDKVCDRKMRVVVFSRRRELNKYIAAHGALSSNGGPLAKFL